MTCLAAFAFQAPAAQQGASVASLIWMFALLAIFWVIMIVPQRKQQKKRMEMLNALKKGDKVITIGGIHGEITEIGDEDIRLRIADKVEIKLTKSSISRVKGE
ncbi:MAG TPA: preprotein translocase subunit YajC [Capillibacterium sp.]